MQKAPKLLSLYKTWLIVKLPFLVKKRAAIVEVMSPARSVGFLLRGLSANPNVNVDVKIGNAWLLSLDMVVILEAQSPYISPRTQWNEAMV